MFIFNKINDNNYLLNIENSKNSFSTFVLLNSNKDLLKLSKLSHLEEYMKDYEKKLNMNRSKDIKIENSYKLLSKLNNNNIIIYDMNNKNIKTEKFNKKNNNNNIIIFVINNKNYLLTKNKKKFNFNENEFNKIKKDFLNYQK